jgi:hypothetical protein
MSPVSDVWGDTRRISANPRKGKTYMRKRLAVVIGVAALCAAVVAPAQAASVRVTKSEANAVLRTFGASSFDPAVIRPFAGLPSDGRHFCGEDWHTAFVTTSEGGDASFTKRDAAVILNATSVSFTLDGSPLASVRTRIKSVPDPSPFVNAYYFNQGRVLSPDKLAVGAHELSVRIIDSSGTFDDGITFFIDAAGTGACL